MPRLQAAPSTSYRLSRAGIRQGDRVAVLFDDDVLDDALRQVGAVPVPLAVGALSSEKLRRSLDVARARGVIVDSEPQRLDVLAVCADLAELDHVWRHADLRAPSTPPRSWTRRAASAVIDNPPVRFLGSILRRRRRRGGGRSETTR